MNIKVLELFSFYHIYSQLFLLHACFSLRDILTGSVELDRRETAANYKRTDLTGLNSYLYPSYQPYCETVCATFTTY